MSKNEIRPRLPKDLLPYIDDLKNVDIDELKAFLSGDPTAVDPGDWIFSDKKHKETPSRSELLDYAKVSQQLKKQIRNDQAEATIEFNVDRPYVAICFSSDWHFGSSATDYNELNEHIETILETDGLFLVTVGDLVDNFKRFKSLKAVLSQAVTPDLQKEWILATIQEIAKRKKWLASCWGNHDVEFDEKIFGESWLAEALGEEFVYFNGKGRLFLKFGDIRYEVAMSHYFKGSSMYNPTHSQSRAKREQYPEADVIVGAHRHNFAYQWYRQFPTFPYTHFLQLGAFKLDDDYSSRYFKPGEIGAPVVLFNSRERETLFFPTARHAAIFLKGSQN